MATSKKVVLVVDDEPDVRAYLSALLEDHGFATVTAEEGQDALEKVMAAPPDLITLDITMPEKSGVRLYRELRESEAHRGIPIVVITGISENLGISFGRHLPPPEGFLAKPIEEREILELINKLI